MSIVVPVKSMLVQRFTSYILMAAVMMAAGCASLPANSPSGPITIERQGSFYVGGRQVTAAGTYDKTSALPSSAGQTFWIDQMYVQYQVPVNARKLPLVLVHGGGGSGRVWETTPDGREGYQTIFLRRGFPVYIVDSPRGGRSGFPSFTGDLGKLDDKQQIVPARTFAAGREQAWSRWRLGPNYPETFEVQAFPMNAVDSFLKHIRPAVAEDPALAGVLDEFLTELSFHLVNLAVAVDPQRIAVGGGMVRSWEMIGPRLRAALDAAVPYPPELVIAAFPYDAPLIGALAHGVAAARGRSTGVATAQKGIPG